MEQTLLAIVLVIGLLLAMPFIINARHQRRKKEVLKHDLLDYMQKADARADHMTCTQQFAIAMDQSRKMVFYLWHGQPHVVREVLIPSLRDVKIDLESLVGNGGQRKLSKISLTLTTNAKSEPDISWIFYDTHDKLQLNGELLLAEEWQGRINAELVK